MTDQHMQSLILEEVRALRTRFDLSAERLSRVETHVESLVGLTQPGRITIVENKVADLQRWRWKTTGIYVGLSGAISALTGVIYHMWK